MSDAQINNSFMKAFVPGLVVGVIVGGLATAVLVPFITERTSTVDAAEIPVSNQAPDRYRVAPEEAAPETPATPDAAVNPDPAAPETTDTPQPGEGEPATPAQPTGGGR